MEWIVDEGTPDEVSGVIETDFFEWDEPAFDGVSFITDRRQLTTKLSKGPHTLKLVNRGLRDWPSSSAPIYIDAIDVLKDPDG